MKAWKAKKAGLLQGTDAQESGAGFQFFNYNSLTQSYDPRNGEQNGRMGKWWYLKKHLLIEEQMVSSPGFQ